jgi:hypothetical protein
MNPNEYPFLMAAFESEYAPNPMAVMPLENEVAAVIAFFSEPILPGEEVRAIYERLDEDTWMATNLRRRVNPRFD